MGNQYTPKAKRAEQTVIKPIRWPLSAWREVQRRAREAKQTESEYVRERTLREDPSQ